MELKSGELFFLHVNREFDFLRKRGYHGVEFRLTGRENYVKFQHYAKAKTVIIALEETGNLSVTVYHKARFRSHKVILRKSTSWDFDYAGLKQFALLLQTDCSESFN